MTQGQSNTVNRQIKGEIYNSLRTALVSPTQGSKKSWTDQFISEMLKEAKKNPSGPLGQLLARQLLQDDIISSLDEQTEKLLSRDQEFLHYRVIKQLYDKQREIAYDTKISHKVIATSRRAGKTNCAARLLVDYCIEPNTYCLYIHTKIDNCLTQCWPLVVECAKQIELPIAREDTKNMRIEFANGSFIQMAGNKDISAAPLLRGGKYKLIIIDEAQDQRNMVELVEDVCEPMLVDFKDSCIILQGTPPRRPKTYFEKCYNSDGWKKYHFTMNDNPFLSNTEEFIERVAKNKGVALDDPLIFREYRGQFINDSTAQVFKDALRFDYQPYSTPYEWLLNEIQNGNFHADYVYCGNDYGFSDYNGLTALAWDKTRIVGYVFYEAKFNQSTVKEIVNKNIEMINQCREVLVKSGTDPSKVCIFGDTSDKSIMYEMSSNYNLPVQCAYKYDKDLGISQMADLLRTHVYVPLNGICQDEIEQTLYERDEEDNITSEISDVYHPDILFSLLYATRQLMFDEDKLFEVCEDFSQNTSPEDDDSYIYPDSQQ